jgi:hypothetical protein
MTGRSDSHSSTCVQTFHGLSKGIRTATDQHLVSYHLGADNKATNLQRFVGLESIPWKRAAYLLFPLN